MDLPPFEPRKFGGGSSFDELAPERFYSTERHLKCADWELTVASPGSAGATVLPVHSQMLASSSPVFADMAAEKVSCDTPIELGAYTVEATVAALRFVYRTDAITTSAARVLLEDKFFSDVLQIGHKFDFWFYEPLMKVITPELVSGVSYSAVLSAASHVFDNDVAELKPVFWGAVSTFMSYLQLSGDAEMIKCATAQLLASPTLMSVALSESLTSPSRGKPHPLYSFCDGTVCKILGIPPAHFTYSFCRVARPDGTLPNLFKSSIFKFEGHSWYLSIDTSSVDSDQPNSGQKYLGVYLHWVGEGALTVKGTLRVMNLRDPGASLTRALDVHEFDGQGEGWGYDDYTVIDDALLPTVWGSICTVQVVSLEKVEDTVAPN